VSSMGTTATLQGTIISLCRSHRCRSRQIFVDAKDFCPNFPKLVRKNFGPLFVQMFSHEDCCWDDVQIKSSCNFGCHFTRIFIEFAMVFTSCARMSADFPQIFSDFAQIFTTSKFWGCICTSLHFRLLHHWSK